MKRILTSCIIAIMAVCFAHAQENAILAFPGADGYGKNATGGRGGEVCYVTRLDDCPDNNLVEGTLRWALRHNNGGKPRTILFKTSGTIYLTSKLRFEYPNVSILGQTAPGGGICLAGYNMYISKNNVIIRHIRFRAGDIPNASMTGLDMENCQNVILDHCSMTWSMEECLTAYDSKYTTVQWCIIGEGLYNSKNAKGARAYATQWGGEHSSMLHTLITNSHSRSPRFNGARDAGSSGHDTNVDSEFANNVVFNWSSTGAIYGGEMKEGVSGYNRVYMINNYYRPGPSTQAGRAGTYFASPSSPYGQWYLNGNKFEESGPFSPWTGPKAASANADNTTAVNGLPSKYLYNVLPSPLKETQYESADEAFKKVTTKAGASLPRYDEVDARLLAEAAGKTKPLYHGATIPDLGIIDSPDDIKLTNAGIYYANGDIYNNYPNLGMIEGEKYIVDTDNDGMPDAYEDAKGLNKNDAADGAADSGNGYTNLEVYLNGIADGILNKQDYETSLTPDIKGEEKMLAATVDGKTYTGYISGGKYYEAGKSYFIAEGETLTPVITVAFDHDGVNPVSVVAGKAITLPTIQKDGYTFKGWSDGTTTYTGKVTFDSSVNLTPVLEKAAAAEGKGTVKVAYALNGTLDAKGAQNVYDESGKLIAATNIFDAATASVGAAFTTMTKTDNKINYFGVQPAQQTSGPDEDNMIEFYLMPMNGIKFKPTGISFKAMRFGTDGGLTNVATKTGTADEVVYINGQLPNRNGNPASEFSVNITEAAPSSEAFRVRIYIYSLGNSKQVGITNLVINGEWEGTAQEAQKYRFSATASPTNGGTIVQSPAGAEFVEDTEIKVTAKASADYVFINWTDAKGNEVTRNQSFTHKLTADAAFTANFRAISSYTDVFKEGSPYDAECRDAQELLIALKAAAKSTADCYRIFLHDGLYDLGNTCLTAVPRNVSLIGESQNGTIIANTPLEEGIGVTATLFISNVQGGGATNIYMQDLTLLNRLDYGAPTTAFAGRAVCLQDKGTRNAYKNVTLLSNQDTYYANKGDQKVYWETSKITGTVDFLCGDASVFLNECEIYVNARNNGNVICAPNTQAGASNWGFVFNSCTVDGDKTTQDGKFSLGRPWNDSPHCTYINTTFKIKPQEAGWTAMGDGKVCRFHEYGSKDAQGNLLDLSKRSIAACNADPKSDPCVVDETFAAKYTVSAVCGAGWDPQALCAQITAPELKAENNNITWAAVDGAYCYAIVRNGKVVDFTTATSYAAADMDTASYAIRVANQRGGLGTMSNIIGTSGIDQIVSMTNATDNRMFTVSGQRVSQSHRGQIYIQNGVKHIAK